jgi:hypothetical protein
VCIKDLSPIFAAKEKTPTMSDGLRDTLKQVSTLSSRSTASTSPLSLIATSDDALPTVDLSTIQRTPRSRLAESDVPHDATVRKNPKKKKNEFFLRSIFFCKGNY